MVTIQILWWLSVLVAARALCPTNFRPPDPDTAARLRVDSVRWGKTACSGRVCNATCELNFPNSLGFSPGFFINEKYCLSPSELLKEGFTARDCSDTKCKLSFLCGSISSIRCVFNNTHFSNPLYSTSINSSCMFKDCGDGSCFHEYDDANANSTLDSTPESGNEMRNCSSNLGTCYVPGNSTDNIPHEPMWIGSLIGTLASFCVVIVLVVIIILACFPTVRQRVFKMLSDFCGRSNESSSHLDTHVQERFIVNRSRDGLESPRVTVLNVRGQGDGTEFGSEEVLNKPVPSINQQSAKLLVPDQKLHFPAAQASPA